MTSTAAVSAAALYAAPADERPKIIDAWGHVNNAVYFTYLEIGRLDYVMGVILETKMRRQSSPKSTLVIFII